ncbi:MAG: hypothetical protein HC769_15050 [Cyanobacteria bacterium CRU_2_1]|nr:hypothetical protein [Cyanobacteria bacterium RU_5_0]NJR60038.1 hypothetical protein [Cyanobacteria bacterium CRU_2_1]
MNDVQHEQLFADLTPTQAEVIFRCLTSTLNVKSDRGIDFDRSSPHRQA